MAGQGKAGGWQLGLAAAGVWLFAFSMFAFVASDQQYGYEGEHAAQAQAYVERWLTVDALGRIQPRARGGILDVGQYVPFALAAHFLKCPDCESTWGRFWYVWVHPFWTAWTIFMLFVVVWTLSRNVRTSVAVALLAATGTVLLPYAKFGMETQQTLWATAALAALLEFRQAPACRQGSVAGFCLGMLALTKITGVTLVFALGGTLVMWALFDGSFRKRVGQRWQASVPILIGGAGGILILLVTNQNRYGAFWARYPWGDRPEFPYFHPLRWWALLASPNKSVFVYSPILLLTLPYWKRFFARFPEMRPLYLALLLLVGFHLSMNTWVDERWWFSRLHFTIPFLTLPLIIWWESGWCCSYAKREIASIVIVAAVMVQLIGTSVNYTALAYVIHPSPALTLENIVWNPHYNHLRFNVLALLSWRSRQFEGVSVPFYVPRSYLPAAPPPSASLYDIFPFKGWDTHDFFLLKQLWTPDVAYGASVARTALALTASGMLLSALLLRRALLWGEVVSQARPLRQFGGQLGLSKKCPWRRK